MNLPILSLITFTPLVGALVLAALPSRHEELIRRIQHRDASTKTG